MLCAACAPVSRLPALDKSEVAAEQRREQIAQMRGYFAELHRVDTVAFRIRVANRHFCGRRVTPQIGLFAATPESLPRRFRSFASEAMDLTWVRPTVISLVEDSPAAKAGMRDHDEIVSLNGELIPVTGTNRWIGAWLKRNGEKPVKVNIRRGSDDMTITVTPVTGCSIPIQYVTSDEVNAFTSEERIVIYSGIAALAKTDAQLATIIGHELAHSNLGHLHKQNFNMIAGAVGGLAVDAALQTGGVFTRTFANAGLHAYSVSFEREADYVGAYYAARAGYDIAGTEELWFTMGQSHPDDLRFARTHPTSPVRFLQMKKVAEEIADKQRRHLPLVPDLKFAEAEPQ
jgi:membrane-associated protease RseP (regulator of RpoE activity)